ncbi:hypothetical protein IYX23_05385 [Methylocystis sp. L43]|uniref:hypothetical protein n=1 Tax=unclassified Methylocystis TaxID=2625913 RepID=UPI0018C27489|nr:MULTISPECIES: hypothetical protein [unclassified Methylocystis]MBG0797119.1 hypothetical protein [Methylocystis sp. L43]MBG0805010.1 hypothetical protein [Methylocystis sp. H15]
MRLLNARKLRLAAVSRLILFGLLISAIPVGSAAAAGAAENYRGHDPDSYECSEDFNILNRFSAPRRASLLRSTKYADIKFTLEGNVIAVKDLSNSKDFVFITVDENTKYCAYKEVELYDRGKATSAKFDVPTCAIKYFVFRMKIVMNEELPVIPFSLPRPPDYSWEDEKTDHFDRMDHFIEIDVYRAVDSKKKHSSARCNETGESPQGRFFVISTLGLMTNNKSTVNVTQELPRKLRNGEYYSGAGRLGVVTTTRPESSGPK